MAEAGTVRTRLAFHFPGYDPRGAPFYYLMLKRNLSDRNRWTDDKVQVAPLDRSRPHPRCTLSTETTRTTWHFMDWEERILREMESGTIRCFLWSMPLLLASLVSGHLYRISREYRWFGLTVLIPLLLFPLMVLAALLPGLAAWWALPATWWRVAVLLAAMAAGGGAMAVALKSDWGRKLVWMANALFIYARIIPGGGLRYESELRAMAAEVRARVLAAEEEGRPPDEILFIGHSFGTLLAMLTADMLLNPQDSDPPLPHDISLLTLGDGSPLSLFAPFSSALRKRIRRVATTPGLCWVDVFAPQDGFNFPEPASSTYGTLFAGEDADCRRSRKSARFKDRVTPERYRRVRSSLLDTHLHYLEAPDHVSRFDLYGLLTWNSRLKDW